MFQCLKWMSSTKHTKTSIVRWRRRRRRRSEARWMDFYVWLQMNRMENDNASQKKRNTATTATTAKIDNSLINFAWHSFDVCWMPCNRCSYVHKIQFVNFNLKTCTIWCEEASERASNFDYFSVWYALLVCSVGSDVENRNSITYATKDYVGERMPRVRTITENEKFWHSHTREAAA